MLRGEQSAVRPHGASRRFTHDHQSRLWLALLDWDFLPALAKRGRTPRVRYESYVLLEGMLVQLRGRNRTVTNLSASVAICQCGCCCPRRAPVHPKGNRQPDAATETSCRWMNRTNVERTEPTEAVAELNAAPGEPRFSPRNLQQT
jgi:hypothetical protein